MGITKSYNKHRDIYYAYETSYQWSEKEQKKVQVRRCIGHFDPVTNEIVPNGKRGPKPSTDHVLATSGEEHTEDAVKEGLESVNTTLISIAESLKTITDILSSQAAPHSV